MASVSIQLIDVDLKTNSTDTVRTALNNYLTVPENSGINSVSLSYVTLNTYGGNTQDAALYLDGTTRAHDNSWLAPGGKELLASVFAAGQHSYRFHLKSNNSTSNDWKLGTVVLTIDYNPPIPSTTSCSAPTSASVSPSVAEGDASLAFSGAAGGTGNAITGYEIQYSESTDGSTWGNWAALKVQALIAGNGTITVAPSGTRGTYRKYQMRTRGAAGASYYSGWKAVSGTVRRNSAPASPGITAPAAGATIYNSKPRILATVGSDADSHAQIISVSGYVPSSAGAQDVGKSLVMRRSADAAAGSLSISATSEDELEVVSAAVERAFTYAVPAWTDPSLTVGTTPIKAVHINELRTAINNVRAYYGMAAHSWVQTITAGSTSLAGWTSHVTELRTAIDQIVALVNGWDDASSDHDISLPAWIAITENKPSAAVINQLRAAIPLL